MSNPVNLDAMRRHINELLAPYTREDLDVGIQIRWLKSVGRACVIHDLGGAVLEIQIAPIRSVISYATALHEIGHILGRHQNSRRSIVRERWAWQWARENAIVWTPQMERCAVQALAFVERSTADSRCDPR